MPSHFKMFLNTQIGDNGVLSGIGNYFLTPIRFLAKGKTIVVTGKNTIAKVSSFNLDGSLWNSEEKHSKQKPELRSTTWGGGKDADFQFKVFSMLVLALPGLILGSFFKGLSFLNPKIGGTHKFVKDMLTPKNELLGSTDQPLSATLLEEKLRIALESGQKIKSLVIYTTEPLNEVCSLLIKKINPFTVMLINEKTQGLAGILPSPNCTHRRIKFNWKFYLNEDVQSKPRQILKPSNAELAKKVFAAKGPGLFEKKHKVFVLTPTEMTSVLSSQKKSF